MIIWPSFSRRVIFFSVCSTQGELAAAGRDLVAGVFCARVVKVVRTVVPTVTRRMHASTSRPKLRIERLSDFSVDATIPRLYIAHALMPYNRTSSRMFRFCFLLVFVLLALSASMLVATNASLGAPGALAPADSPHHAMTGIDVYE